MIRAIETSYDGRLFRSRAEARWAAFFKALGLVYEYEPEGLELPDSRRYLPDFRINLVSRFGKAPVYFEVKGDLANDDGKLAAAFDAFPSDTLSRTALLPSIELYRDRICNTRRWGLSFPTELRHRPFDSCYTVVASQGAFTVCEDCGEVGFEPLGRNAWMACCIDPESDDEFCARSGSTLNFDAPLIVRALDYALSHRFGT